MILLNTRRHLIATLTMTLFIGCSSISGKNITETELAIPPTESPASFSQSVQLDIALLPLSPDQLGDPDSLEALPSLTALTPSGRRSIVIAEAWHLRGQNDVEVPIATSLQRYLRAAHFAYEGIFAGDSCTDVQSQLCKDLYAAYNRSTREVARLTNNGGDLLAADGLSYIVDLAGDGDPLTLREWELTLEDYNPLRAHPALGASGAACQLVKSDATPPEIAAHRCAPTSFLVLFDERTDASRSRAHIVAYDTFEHETLALHGQEVLLHTNTLSAWNKILSPSASPKPGLSCLSGVAPSLPTVVLLTAPGASSNEWAVIGSALAADQNLADHYNFCAASNLAATAGSESLTDALTIPLRLLAPTAAHPLQVVLVSEGSENEQIVRTLKQSLKDGREAHGKAPLALAGSLVLTASHPALGSAPPPHATTTSELSRHCAVALRDINRLLTKLADSEEGVFGAISRSHVPHGPGETLSPVM